jgi:hypothetical protein
MARAERLAGRRDKAFAYQPVAPDADILAKLAELADASERRFTVNWDMFTTRSSTLTMSTIRVRPSIAGTVRRRGASRRPLSDVLRYVATRGYRVRARCV